MARPLRKHLTVRNLPPDIALALDRERQRRDLSLNQTVVDLLRIGLGLTDDEDATNGLEKLAGDWSEEEFQSFESATEVFSRIEPELWK